MSVPETAEDAAVTPALFERVGIEIEYAIVDRETLAVRPIADRLLVDGGGHQRNSRIAGPVEWSNELARHVLELKGRAPLAAPYEALELFPPAIATLQTRLGLEDAILLPGATHPWMDPTRAGELWPHGDREIYRAFDRIFGCRGHGWFNCQSVHVNLPFRGDEEFRRLHAAVRAVLPLIPGLAAASPYQDGTWSGRLDARLHAYRHHCDAVAEVVALVVPEVARSQEEYRARILKPMYRAIAPHDPTGLLQEEWLNARGAIARFERSTIEVRLIDAQECPAADLAIAAAVSALIRALVEERWCDLEALEALPTATLAAHLERAVVAGDEAAVSDRDLLEAVGWPYAGTTTQGELWSHLVHQLAEDPWLGGGLHRIFTDIVRRGPLGRVLQLELGEDPTRQDLERVWRELASCLSGGSLYGDG